MKQLARSLATDSKHPFLQMNKSIARQTSLHAAALLMHLQDIQINWNLPEEFIRTRQQIANEVCITEHQAKKAIDELVEAGLLSYRRDNISLCNKFKIHYEKIIEMIENEHHLPRERASLTKRTSILV